MLPLQGRDTSLPRPGVALALAPGFGLQPFQGLSL